MRRQAPRRLAGAGFCLVGDAAGLARDLSGEGIGPAIRSGRLAAAAARALLREGASLAGYAREIVALYGPGEPGWLGRQVGRLPTPWPERRCGSFRLRRRPARVSTPSSAREAASAGGSRSATGGDRATPDVSNSSAPPTR